MSDVLTNTDPWSKMLTPGVVLWRNCGISLVGGMPTAKVSEVEFEDTEQGSFIARVQLTGAAGMWEPEVLSNRKGEHFTRGIAMFLQELPPPNWTHLLVSGVSLAFNEPGRPEHGGCIFGQVVVPVDMDSYLDFRVRLFQAYRQAIRAAADQAADVSDGVWPDGIDHCTRLIIQNAWQRTTIFHYRKISK